MWRCRSRRGRVQALGVGRQLLTVRLTFGCCGALSFLLDSPCSLLIIANSIVLAMTNYSEVTANGQLDTSDPFNRAVDESELVFTTLFAIEMVLKIIAMGFVLERGAYLRDPWNVLDFIVVMAG